MFLRMVAMVLVILARSSGAFEEVSMSIASENVTTPRTTEVTTVRLLAKEIASLVDAIVGMIRNIALSDRSQKGQWHRAVYGLHFSLVRSSKIKRVVSGISKDRLCLARV